MKPVRFDYERPRDLASALKLIGDEGARVIAGGQSLGPMLNLRLVQPKLLVDVTGIAELQRAELRGDELIIGACVTHADIEDGRVPDVTGDAVPGVARAIAYRAVRNRGTIGGSLTFADPAADWISALAALGASVTLRFGDDARTMPVEDYMVGALEAALAPGELLEAVRIPKLSPAARWGFFKACRKTGEYAHAIGAVLIDPERSVCRAVMGAIEAKPIVIGDASPLLGGNSTLDGFDAGLADAVLRKADIDNPIDRQIHVVALRRAAEAARR